MTLCGAITPFRKSGKLVSMLGTEMRHVGRKSYRTRPGTCWPCDLAALRGVEVCTPGRASASGGKQDAQRGLWCAFTHGQLAYMTQGPSPPPRHHSHPQGTQPCPLSREWTETPPWNLFIPRWLCSGGKSGTTTKAQETMQTCSDSTLASQLSDWWSGFPGAAY